MAAGLDGVTAYQVGLLRFHLAIVMPLRGGYTTKAIVTAKLNDIDPQAWPANGIARLPEMSAMRDKTSAR